MTEVHRGQTDGVFGLRQLQLHLVELHLHLKTVVLQLHAVTHGTLHIAVELLEQHQILLSYLLHLRGLDHIGISLISLLYHLGARLALILAGSLESELRHLVAGNNLATHKDGLTQHHAAGVHPAQLILQNGLVRRQRVEHAGSQLLQLRLYRGRKTRHDGGEHTGRRLADIHAERTVGVGIAGHTG